MHRRVFVPAIAVCGGLIVGLLCSLDLSSAAANGGRGRPRFDVAMNGFTFSFEGNTNANGYPAKGTPFVIEGYIYPAGTFARHGELSGVNPDGSPEFPDRVLGTWICRGWHLQDGDAVTGPVVATTQIFDLDPARTGLSTLTTDGIELADFDVVFYRAVTGGTGRYREASGQHSQVYVGGGVNVTGGFNTSFEFRLAD